MQPEVFAIVGTLSGAIVVGVINYFSNRSVKNHEWRLALARDQISMRQKLYSELLAEAQRLVIQAREEKASSLSDLNHGGYIPRRLRRSSHLATSGSCDAKRKIPRPLGRGSLF